MKENLNLDVGSRGLAKVREGQVTSNKMDKTVVVSIVTQKKHFRYSKYVKRTKKYMAHDQENQCQIGDRVRIIETRPLSKNKRWRVQEVLEKAI
jgi:small subunit ribosomal protein S17